MSSHTLTGSWKSGPYVITLTSAFSAVSSTPTKLLPAYTHYSQNLNTGFWLIQSLLPGMPGHSSLCSAKTASTYVHMWNLLNFKAHIEYLGIHLLEEIFLDCSRPAVPRMRPGTPSLALTAILCPHSSTEHVIGIQ